VSYTHVIARSRAAATKQSLYEDAGCSTFPAHNDEYEEDKLKIEKTIEENHEARLVVEVEPEKMETYKRRAARKLSERGKIPGFRPGKAPYEMVVRNFGEQAILEQAVDNFVDAEYSNILKEAGVEPGASGTLESIDSLEPPKMTFRIPLAPEVDLGVEAG
jgi:trigger factor